MSQTFLSTFCGAPVVPKNSSLTKQDVENHFTSYIENACVNPVTVVKYSMPKEFYGRISVNTFWSIIHSFLCNQMKFSVSNRNYGSLGMLFDSDYNTMPYQSFYLVKQEQASHHGEYFMQDYICNYDNKIDFVAFRIFKAQ